MYKIENYTEPNETQAIDIMKIWENAVRATHSFLTESDIVNLRPIVKQAIQQIGNLSCYVGENHEIQGFIGIDGDKIEMLFVDNSQRGKGIGKRLISHAIENFDIKYVNVNEQNTQGCGFYEHIGFKVFKRSPVDEQGNPFPILHLCRSSMERSQ